VRHPLRAAGTAVAAATFALALAPAAGALTTTAAAADSVTVATAPSSAEAAAWTWKCRWPSYRNAHPWRCRGFHRFHRHHGWRDHDGDGRCRGDRRHDEGPPTGAVTKHPGPVGHDGGEHHWQHDGDGPGGGMNGGGNP